jgi:hypothetical protein
MDICKEQGHCLGFLLQRKFQYCPSVELERVLTYFTMNLAINFLKGQGFKVFVPLLFLATACGEGGPSATQADLQTSSEETALSAAAQPSTSFGTPKTTSASPVLPPSAPVAAPTSATQVPEPMAIAGLAMTAAGLIVVKRKRIA